MTPTTILRALLPCVLAAGAHAQPAATFNTRQLTPETALTAARAALEHCRKGGY
jgi:hypothetical protein